MPLSDRAIRNLAPDERPYKRGDSGGLFLLVTPSGGRWWRFKYRFDGKAKAALLRHLSGRFPRTPHARSATMRASSRRRARTPRQHAKRKAKPRRCGTQTASRPSRWNGSKSRRRYGILAMRTMCGAGWSAICSLTWANVPLPRLRLPNYSWRPARWRAVARMISPTAWLGLPAKCSATPWRQGDASVTLPAIYEAR